MQSECSGGGQAARRRPLGEVVPSCGQQAVAHRSPGDRMAKSKRSAREVSQGQVAVAKSLQQAAMVQVWRRVNAPSARFT